MSFTVTPLSEACGARIDGLDLANPLERETVEALVSAWQEHVVLVFRDQTLSPAQQLDFARYFGDLGKRARPPGERPEGSDADYIMRVTNIRKDGKPVGSLPDGEMYFHHDKCYTAVPDKGSILHAIAVPDTGGDTLFANMYNALEALPESISEQLKSREALQVYQFDPTVRPAIGDDLSEMHHRFQPAVIRHPDTGRPALYLNQLMTARIEGLSEAESDQILETVIALFDDPKIVYRHEWAVGDVVMWDNRASCHARTDFPADQVRDLRRCTIKGDGPMVAA